MANLNMVQAINLALIQEMEKDPRVLLLGEDVGANVGGAEQLMNDVQSGVAVEGGIALPAAGETQPSDEKPGAENTAEEKQVPEKPGDG